MTKRNSPKYTFEPKVASREREYITSSGKTVLLRGLPPLAIPSLAEGITFPDIPTYKITTVAGDTEVHEHDETTLATDEDKAVWAKYLDDQKKANNQLSERMMLCVLIDGIVIDEIPDKARWISKQRLMKMPVPEDLEEQLLLYKKTAIAASQEDIENIMSIVMELTGVSAEEIALAKRSFPGDVESGA